MSEKDFKIRELERLFSEHKITLDQYLDARATIDKGKGPSAEPLQETQQLATPQNYPNAREPPRALQTSGPRRSYKKMIIGIILVLIVLASGFFAWHSLSSASVEALTIESYSMKASKAALVLKLKNTGNTNIQITEVKMNGYSHQSLPPMFQEGWNGTTFLQPQQSGLLYVYIFTYQDALEPSIPHLSSPPTETEIDDFFTWIDSYDTILTIATSTQRQYEVTVNTLAVWLAMAWLGSLTFTFMKTEAVEVLDYSWDTTNRAYIDLKVKNTGTGTTTINEIRANNVATSINGTTTDRTLDPGETVWIRAAYTFTAGTRYEFTMVAASGTRFPSFIATCP